MTDDRIIRLAEWFQGPTGSGQGGWTAQRVEAAVGEPVTVAIKRPIPLDTDMSVVEADDSWHLVTADEPDEPILIARRWEAHFAETDTISVVTARDARTRFPLHDDHPVPVCFSCGARSDSMKVHSGALADGRWATDWTVPSWAVDASGIVDEGVLWAAIDCAQAWYVGNAGGRRHAVTVQLAVEMLAPLDPGATYALVSWEGSYPRDWDGRKRGAGGAVFADNGTCVARSNSFWLAV